MKERVGFDWLWHLTCHSTFEFSKASKNSEFFDFRPIFRKKSEYFEKLLLNIFKKTTTGVTGHAGSNYGGIRTFWGLRYRMNREKSIISGKNRIFDRQQHFFSNNWCNILNERVKFDWLWHLKCRSIFEFSRYMKNIEKTGFRQTGFRLPPLSTVEHTYDIHIEESTIKCSSIWKKN